MWPCLRRSSVPCDASEKRDDVSWDSAVLIVSKMGATRRTTAGTCVERCSADAGEPSEATDQGKVCRSVWFRKNENEEMMSSSQCPAAENLRIMVRGVHGWTRSPHRFTHLRQARCETMREPRRCRCCDATNLGLTRMVLKVPAASSAIPAALGCRWHARDERDQAAPPAVEAIHVQRR